MNDYIVSITRPSQGLGLYIVRALARAYGGDVAVESKPGQGRHFVLAGLMGLLMSWKGEKNDY